MKADERDGDIQVTRRWSQPRPRSVCVTHELKAGHIELVAYCDAQLSGDQEQDCHGRVDSFSIDIEGIAGELHEIESAMKKALRAVKLVIG